MHSLSKRLNVRDESAFTLIELLVVLIIIGVLLAIAIPSYLGFQKSAQQTGGSVLGRAQRRFSDATAYFSGSQRDVRRHHGHDCRLSEVAVRQRLAGLDRPLRRPSRHRDRQGEHRR